MAIRRAQFRDYAAIRWRLTQEAAKKKIPLRGIFELTYRCNHRCVHCYTAPYPDKREITTEETMSILSQLKDAGCFYLGFTGGEIFMRPDILEILNHAHRCGFQLILKTNGTLIDERIADFLATLNINKVDLSLLGAKEETFDSITQIKGSFKRFLNTIDLLKKRSIETHLKTCVMNTNIGEFADMKRFAKERRLNFSYDPLLTPKSDGSCGPLKFRLTGEEIIELRKTLTKRWREKHKNDKRFPKRPRRGRIDYSRFFRCGAGRYIFTIGPYGEMKTCIDIGYPAADILEKGVLGAWQEVAEFIESFRPSSDYKCAACELNRYCGWCPARGLLDTGDLNKCSPFHKKMAMLRAKEAGWRVKGLTK